jgi:hypothetical protein
MVVLMTVCFRTEKHYVCYVWHKNLSCTFEIDFESTEDREKFCANLSVRIWNEK